MKHLKGGRVTVFDQAALPVMGVGQRDAEEQSGAGV